ncbi:hypothetical protein NYE80_19835 [Paenibacillus sp. FSL H7-0357]|uniref:hypothetical protein n=1 Tax=Paenibacillus sp. FSL H7-0357 TaxID=1536774 RepID=UPI000690AE4A|nr:hypothetical protein [Paenibacillus sp. FSL H7-0357]
MSVNTDGKMLTNEEREMVRDLILLPYIDTLVAKSLKEVEHSGNLLSRSYILTGRYIQKRIIQEVYQLRQALKQRNIKVVEDTQDDFITYSIIYNRGYQERFGITRDVMRTEISLRLNKYTTELGEVLKDHLK